MVWALAGYFTGESEGRHQRDLAARLRQQTSEGIHEGGRESTDIAGEAVGSNEFRAAQDFWLNQVATTYQIPGGRGGALGQPAQGPRTVVTGRREDYGDIAAEMPGDYEALQSYYQNMLTDTDNPLMASHRDQLRQAQASRGMYFGPASARDEARRMADVTERYRMQAAQGYSGLLGLRAQTRMQGRQLQQQAAQNLMGTVGYEERYRQSIAPQLMETQVRGRTGGVMGWQSGHPNPTPMNPETAGFAAGAAGQNLDTSAVSSVLGAIFGGGKPGGGGGGGGGGNTDDGSGKTSAVSAANQTPSGQGPYAHWGTGGFQANPNQYYNFYGTQQGYNPYGNPLPSVFNA